MTGKKLMIIGAAGLFMAAAITAGCLRRGAETVVREPEAPGESTISYTPPPAPSISLDMVRKYTPLLTRMLTGKVTRVTDDVYVATGYALGNVIMIITNEGLVIIDSTESGESAREIMADFRKVTDRPVKKIIYTHFHPDHIEGTAMFFSEGVEVIATNDFLYWVNYQNVMLREHHLRSRSTQSGRISPDYAFSIPFQSPFREMQDEPVIMPNITFDKEYSFTLGGKRFELFHTWGETEDHLAVWMPGEKILFPGDLYYHSFPNLSTPMLESRPVQGWIESIDRFLTLGPEVMVPQHSWPVEGREKIKEHLTNYRDAIKYVHDKTVECINQGKTVDQAAAEIRLPERLARLPYLQEYYGRIEWSVRGIYHGYKGWYDGKGTGLHPLPPEYRSRELVALAGGADKVLARAIELQKNGEHQLCVELCDVIIAANPDDRLAHRVKAESLHHLAYAFDNLNCVGFYRSAYSMEMEAAGEVPQGGGRGD